jgi:general secretion pathway protein E
VQNKLNLTDKDKIYSLETLAIDLGYVFLSKQIMLGYQPAFDILKYADMLEHECILFKNEEHLIFVFHDLSDQNIQNWAASKIDKPFTSAAASKEDLIDILMQYEKSLSRIDMPLQASSSNKLDDLHDLKLAAINEDPSPVIRFTHSVLYDALKFEASDIHAEMTISGLIIKYRLDGVLSKITEIQDHASAIQFVSRIKVMANLDITEQRVPQDGRFQATYQNRDVDFRVSIMPSSHGEDVVIRILDKQALADETNKLRLDLLGFDKKSIDIMRQHFKAPYGLVLVTGPTGSGKTTTLYAAISEINNGSEKIITIEDPIEYELKDVLQIPVNEKKGLTFAKGLRSILRHDPDKIMVGEIRDSETAQIAIQSSLTGHLVFTTVHANNAFDVISRFINMNVDLYSFVSALNIIVAQRLIRTLCKVCSEPTQIAKDFLPRNIKIPKDAVLMKACGCEFCRGTGFKGRRAVAEIIALDDTLRDLISARSSIKAIKEYASLKGMQFLSDSALAMAWSGETTLDEILRVTSV